MNSPETIVASSATSCSGLHSASLYSLSDEILIMIVNLAVFGGPDYLLRYDWETANGLSECSRRLRNIAEPLLYCSFYYSVRQKSSLPLFVLDLLVRPELQKQVRYISSTAQTNDPSDGINATVKTPDWERIRHAVKASSGIFSAEEQVAWLGDLEEGTWDSWMTLLISVSPNLLKLTFDEWRDDPDHAYPHFWLYLDRAPSVSAMSRLKNVSIAWYDTEGGMDTSTFEPFLALDSVVEFHGGGIHEQGQSYNAADSWEPWEEEYDPGYFKTRDLELYNCSLEPQKLVNFLLNFPCLERLVFTNSGVKFEEFIPPHMMRGLKHLEPCLQELILDDHRRDNIEGNRLWAYPLGSLAKFKKLRYIEADASMLIGVPNNWYDEYPWPSTQNLTASLPASLEHLHMRTAWREPLPLMVRDATLELVKRKETCTPLLSFLDIGWYLQVGGKLNPPGFSEREAAEMLEACEEANITMVYRHDLKSAKEKRMWSKALAKLEPRPIAKEASSNAGQAVKTNLSSLPPGFGV